jgi:hypothetical protein
VRGFDLGLSGVVNGLADLPPIDAEAWVRDAREVDDLLSDADRAPWA